MLVPALERASLESPNSDFLEKWANLLASEATNPADDTGLFSSILAELGSIEATILHDVQIRLVDSGYWRSETLRKIHQIADAFLNGVGETIRQSMMSLIDGNITEIDAREQIWSKLTNSPVVVFGVHFMKDSETEKYIGTPATREKIIAVDILESRNLMNRLAYRDFVQKRAGVMSVHYFLLTSLGVRFLERVSGMGL